jgi:triacylglycerol lipase
VQTHPTRIGRGRALWIGLLALCLIGAPDVARANSGQVVLVHGLARGASSMEELADALREAGYTVRNFDYPSTEMPPDELVALLGEEVRLCCASKPGRLHFVTHSLGGILVRALLEEQRPGNLGRVVMLAPPNRGSEIIDSMGENGLFEAAMGPTAARLGTDSGSFPNSIGPPSYEVGIVAGSQSINPVGSALLPGPDDGAVTIERTRLEGASDFVLIPATHTFIMQNEVAIEQVLHFLRNGRFRHDAEQTSTEEISSPAAGQGAR